MKENLTEQEEMEMEKTKNKWIMAALEPEVFNEEKAKEYIDFCYFLSDRPPPKKVIVKSPMAAQLEAHKLLGEGKKVEYVPFSFSDLMYDANWLAFYDFFKKIGVLEDENFDKYSELCFESRIHMNIMLDGIVIISKPPVELHLDEDGDLHSLTGPAVLYEDGYGVYAINGVRFKKELHEKVVSKSMPMEEIFNIENIEQRTVAFRILGYENILKSSNAKVIDRKKVTVKGEEREYQLFEVDLKDDDVPARFLKVICPSTGKEAVLRVDPNVEQTKTCEGARAWTFGKTKDEFAPSIET